MYQDGQSSDASRLLDDSRMPWHGFTRPFRPQKSRKRPLVLSSYADHSQQPQPLHLAPQATSTPRERKTSASRRDSHYHYRRRSQSLFDFTEARRTSTVRSPTRANTGEVQYAFDPSQSHVLPLTDDDHDYIDDDGRPSHEEPVKTASTFHSRASTRSTRSHPTPPMTPDDGTLSTTSTSPMQDRSFSPPLLEDLPAEVKVEITPAPDDEDDEDDVVSQSNRNTIIADTPVTGAEFSILLPPPPMPTLSIPDIIRPPSAPPSPIRDEPMSASIESRRQVESDSEAVVGESLRRRSQHTSFKRFRRPPSVITTGIRGKPISSPSPIATHPPQRPETSAAPVASVGLLRAIGEVSRPTLAPSVNLSSANPSMEDGRAPSYLEVPAGPKPQKSLSHVNLGLKPLPNMSLAPTVASANTSIASLGSASAPAPVHLSVYAPQAKAAGGLTRSRPERTVTAPAPAAPSVPVRHEARRAQTDTQIYAPSPETIEKDAYTTDLGYRRTAYHRDTTVPPPPRAKSPDYVVEPDRRTVVPPRRGSDPAARAISPIPPIPAPIPAPKPVSALLKPSATTTSKPIPVPTVIREAYVRQAPTPEPKDDPPTCYRKPEPLPLSPPPRAKSPMASRLITHAPEPTPESVLRQETTPPPPQRIPSSNAPPARARSPTPERPRVRSPTPERPRARSPTPERPRVRRRDTDDRSSEHNSHRSDEGYFPVAQLRPGPSMRSSVARTGSAMAHSTTKSMQAQAKKVKPPPKDLDSPLPPPPSEPQQDISMMTPSLAVLSPPPATIAPMVTPPRRQRTAPPTPMLPLNSPAITTRSHDAYHTRSCSGHGHHWTRDTNSPTSETYPPNMPFDERAVPTADQLACAADIPVIAPNGVRVPFGDIFNDRKVVVIFIRHFW